MSSSSKEGGAGSDGVRRAQAEQPHRFKTEEDYNAFLRVSHESTAIGQNTLTALAGQQETLDRVETAMDSNQYLVDRSARTLRGMTWWGSVVNFFTEEPPAPRPRRRASWTQEEARQRYHREHGYEPPTHRTGSFADLPTGNAPNPPPPPSTSSSSSSVTNAARAGEVAHRQRNTLNVAHAEGEVDRQRSERDELFIRRTTQPKRPPQGPPQSLAEVKRAQDNYLDALSRTLEEQRRVGGTMGVALTEQSTQMEGLGDRADRLQESTRSVIRKASRISQGSWGETAKFVCNVALREINTGKYLTVVGENIELLDENIVQSCVFAIFSHQSNISGFQSRTSKKWLGQTFTGALKVSGHYFGRREEWEMDFKSPTTFLLCCSGNWGNGAYLMVTEKGELRLGRCDVEDRKQAARFQMVDTDMYSSSDYVNDVLRPLKREADRER